MPETFGVRGKRVEWFLPCFTLASHLDAHIPPPERSKLNPIRLAETIPSTTGRPHSTLPYRNWPAIRFPSCNFPSRNFPSRNFPSRKSPPASRLPATPRPQGLPPTTLKPR